ncbi:AAA family ATPase [Kitasatospora purpeofusca]|uniref:AAA family ATPase n=1 Tax=Kitasatospora purpeofusca TaxID=67352 RepID=UPI0036A9FCA8
MRPHHLTITAFGPFAGTETVDFDELTNSGVFLLHGDTGAGKTSVLDALCFALYGRVPGQRPEHRLRSHHAPVGIRTAAALEFTAADRRFKIMRTPKQSYPSTRAKNGIATAEATVQFLERITGPDGAHHWQAISSSHQEANKEVTDILGLTKEQFCQVVLLPQGEFAAFLHAGAEERRKLLGKLFGTRRFRDLTVWLANRAKALHREADDATAHILLLAERIDQEAGPTLTARTDARPDERHLTAWLPWARRLAATAEDDCTVAAAQARQAEQTHQAAKDHLSKTSDLAGKQARHQRAVAQRAALEETATDHPRLRQQLEAGRRAEPLRPLLDQTAAHTKALKAAKDAESRARLLLDAQDTSEDIPGLQAAHQRLHAEKGRLEGLLPEEERHAALSEQLDALREKEKRAQEEHDEAEAWLKDWLTTLEHHTGKIADLERAVQDLPSLETTHKSLTLQLATAVERDALAVRLSRTTTDETEREKEMLRAHQTWLDLRQRRMDGMAGELAAVLETGQPCQVCGSPVHPAPARPAADQPTRQDEDIAQENYDEARKAHEEAMNLRSDLAAQHARTVGAAGTDPVPDLQAKLADATATQDRAQAEAAELHPAQEALTRLQNEHETQTNQRNRTREALTEIQARSTLLAQQESQLAAVLTQARAGEASLTKRLTSLTTTADRLATALDAAQATESAEAHLAETQRTTADATVQAGFDDLAEATAALSSSSVLQHWHEQLDQWGKQFAVVDSILAEAEILEAARQPQADPAVAQEALAHAESSATDAAVKLQQALERAQNLAHLTADLDARVAAAEPLRAESALVDRLAGVAAGTGAVNTLSMELEAYVLAGRLEQIADAANKRLSIMTNDRYQLRHSHEKETGQGRAKAGLGLRIRDGWTGVERETSTLSGGETFTTALALALGLADVVTQEASGRPLGTLFIDEGFGSLDEQSLTDVMDVLDHLRAGNRAVGVVSHVGELRRRIPTQLHVKKRHQAGSIVHPLVDADI